MQYTTTLLCEVINEEMPSLDLILRNKVTSSSLGVSETTIKLIEEQFIVHSWDEFLNKFQPILYEVSLVDAVTGIPTIQYTTVKPDVDAPKIEFKRGNPLMNSFLQLMDHLAMDGKTNAYFEFSEALKNGFSPEKLKKEAEQLKKDMLYLADEFEKLDDTDPQKDIIGDKLAENIQKASSFFKNNTSLLQLAQATVGQQLLSLAKQNEEKDGDEPLALTYASFEITEQGINAIEVPIKQLDLSDSSEKVSGQQKLIGYISNYYDHVTQTVPVEENVIVEKPKESYQKQLVVSALTGGNLVQLTAEAIPQTVEQYNRYVDLTANVMSSYYKAVSELFGKIIGVKQFFDEYEKNAKSKKIAPRLLVANAKLEDLVKLDEFKLYIDTIHSKGSFFSHGLTAAIVPGVALKEATLKQEIPEIDPLGRVKKPKKEQKIEGVQVNDVKKLASLLSPYKTPVFFGFKGDSSTFNSIQDTAFVEEIEPFLLKIKEQKDSWQEVFVPCYPNLTIIPDKSNLTTAVRVELEGDSVKKGEESKIQLPGFYVDASYVAASLIVSHYCPGYLKEKYKEHSDKIDDTLPGVRISLSEHSTQTTLPIEVKSLPSALLDRINNVSIGFVLMSQNNPVTKGKVTVYSSNTSQTNSAGKARPIHRLLVERYVYYMVRESISGETVEQYKNELNDQKKYTIGNNLKNARNKFNSIFRENEEVRFEENGFLTFTFNEEQNPIKVEIKSEI